MKKTRSQKSRDTVPLSTVKGSDAARVRVLNSAQSRVRPCRIAKIAPKLQYRISIKQIQENNQKANNTLIALNYLCQS
jgi:hypothetical protein